MNKRNTVLGTIDRLIDPEVNTGKLRMFIIEGEQRRFYKEVVVNTPNDQVIEVEADSKESADMLLKLRGCG